MRMACLAVALLFFSGSVAHSVDISDPDYIKELVHLLNQTLPHQKGSQRLDSVTFNGRAVAYHITLTDIQLEEFASEAWLALRQLLYADTRLTILGNGIMRVWLAEGYTIKYVYWDADGGLIVNAQFSFLTINK